MVDKYIELNTFVKIKGFANSGGSAKLLIRSGAVKVNGIVETQNKKKLYPNNVIEISGERFVLSADEIIDR